MKHLLLLIVCATLMPTMVWAQESHTDTLSSDYNHTAPYIGPTDGFIDDPLFPAPYHSYPDTWWVHEGVNAKVEMSATVGLSRHSPSGVGLGRSIDLLYVSPIKNKWNYTLGATTTAFDWSAFTFHDAGIYGSANYYPTDKVALSVSGYKSILPNNKTAWPWLGGHMDSYVGGNLNLKFNRNASMEIHVGTSTWKP